MLYNSFFTIHFLFQQYYISTCSIEDGDLLADSHNILNTWKNYFSQLFNIHRISNVIQIEIHRTDPIVPDHSTLDVEIPIAKLEKFKLKDSEQIPAEFIQSCPSSWYRRKGELQPGSDSSPKNFMLLIFRGL
jgi:hypothetical protein